MVNVDTGMRPVYNGGKNVPEWLYSNANLTSLPLSIYNFEEGQFMRGCRLLPFQQINRRELNGKNTV